MVRSQGLTDTQGGQLIELFAAPPVVSITPAGDGSGTATVTAAAAVTAGSTGNNITIVYTAAGPMIDGAVSVEIPAGWSPPGGRTSVSSTGTIGDWTFVEQTVVVEDVSSERKSDYHLCIFRCNSAGRFRRCCLCCEVPGH